MSCAWYQSWARPRVGADVARGAEKMEHRFVGTEHRFRPAVVDVGRLGPHHRRRGHDATGQETATVVGRPLRRLPGDLRGVRAQVDQRRAGQSVDRVVQDVVHGLVIGEAEEGVRGPR